MPNVFKRIGRAVFETPVKQLGDALGIREHNSVVYHHQTVETKAGPAVTTSAAAPAGATTTTSPRAPLADACGEGGEHEPQETCSGMAESSEGITTTVIVKTCRKCKHVLT